MDEMNPLLTSEAVAKYLNVEVITVRRLVKSGKLAAYRIGGEYRFSQEDVQTYLEQNYQPPRVRRLTQRAKHVVPYAIEEVRSLRHATVQFEHILIGLIREQEGVAGKVISEQGITLEQVRDVVRIRLGVGAEESPDCLGLHPDVKAMMERAVREAKALHHDYVGTEHLLLAFLATEATHDLVQQVGLKPDTARERVLQLLTRT